MDNNNNFGNATQNPPSSTLAIVSLVSGILGWSFAPFIGAVVAVITGHLAKKEIREQSGHLTGDGLATAGLILGYTNIALSFCGICALIAYLIFVVGIVSATSEYNSLIGYFI